MSGAGTGCRTPGWDGSWPAYFDAVAGQPPRETLLIALRNAEAERRAAGAGGLAGPGGERGGVESAGHVAGTCPCHPDAVGVALDFGCGSGRDTLEMLSRGWCVLAVDSHPEAIKRLSAAVPERLSGLLRTGVESFQEMPLPPGMFDLVNCSFSIPHCRPEEFAELWPRLAGSVKAGGRFAGQLFGPRDSWVPAAGAGPVDGVDRTFHDRAAVEELFRGFRFEHLEEVDRPGKNAFGEPKHWHVFHIVARKGQ